MSKKPLLLLLSAVVPIVSGCGGGSSTTTETRNTPQALVVSTSSLPNGNVQSPYSATLASTGGTLPVIWAVSVGAVSAGLNLNAATGQISGTPTTAGAYTFTVKATDSGSPAQSTTTPLSITINAQPLIVSSTSLPNGNVQYFYRATLASTGGTQPVSWTVSVGAIPSGVSLEAATGQISGMPTTAGIYNFTVKAMDSGSPAQSTTTPLSITINEPPPVIDTGRAPPPFDSLARNLPPGAINSAYSFTLQARGGKPPLTWRVIASTLPFGLALNAATGQISGIATTDGTFSFTVQVADSTSPPQTDSQELNITINPALGIATTTLPNSAVNCPYDASLESSGGTPFPPATWSIIAGGLPAGLLLDPTGRISGTPTTAGTVSFTVHAKDSSTPVQVASKNLSLTIAATPQGGCWRDTGAMGSDRGSHTATLLQNGNVLVAGGDSALDPSGSNSVELYSPSNGSWTITGSMNVGRSGHTATLFNNGKVLVAGGSGSSAELYDPGMGTWIFTGGMSIARSGHTATLLLDGKVLVAGGAGDPTTELYDPTAGTWSRTGSMTAGRSGGQTATRLNDGRVLVAGGSNGGTVLATAELYNPATDTWARTGSMGVARSGHTATLLKNGKVLAVGGINSADAPQDAPQTAELYDPATESWAPAASMKAGHYDHTATLLNDGTALVAGGANAFGDPIATAEIYDPIARTWTSALNNMRSDRFDHTATLLNDGKVLVTGGFVGQEGYCGIDGCSLTPIYTSSAEIYYPGP